jgi:hypothetical protein
MEGEFTCGACADGYAFKGMACVEEFLAVDITCNAAEYKTVVNETQVCLACLDNCEACGGGDTCTKCIAGFDLVENNTVC